MNHEANDDPSSVSGFQLQPTHPESHEANDEASSFFKYPPFPVASAFPYEPYDPPMKNPDKAAKEAEQFINEMFAMNDAEIAAAQKQQGGESENGK